MRERPHTYRFCTRVKKSIRTKHPNPFTSRNTNMERARKRKRTYSAFECTLPHIWSLRAIWFYLFICTFDMCCVLCATLYTFFDGKLIKNPYLFWLFIYLFVLLWHFASHLVRTLDVWGRFYLHVFFKHFNWEQMESGWIRVRRIKNVLIVCRQLIWQNHPIKKQ